MKRIRIVYKIGFGFAVCVILSVIIGIVAVVSLDRIRADTVKIKIAKDIEKEVLECRRQEKNIMLFGPYERPTLEEEKEKTYLEKMTGNLNSLKKLVKEGKKIAVQEFIDIQIEIENYEDSLKKIVDNYDKGKKEIDDSILTMRRNARSVEEIAQRIMGVAEARINSTQRGAKRVVWLTLILAALFGPGVSVMLSRNIVNPIRKLTSAVILIAKGDLTQRVDIKATDEIGDIAISFNKMASDIQNLQEKIQSQNEELSISNEELRASNEELNISNEELQVATEELRQSNEELNVLKKDLEKKVFDLERFNKLAVGRELKMRELKETIKELEKRLG